MGQRLDLHDIFRAILGSNNVYFQPPPTIKIEYPCIIYTKENVGTKFADNSPYMKKTRYQVTVIDRDPDSIIPGKVSDLESCIFDRFYTSENLNHDVFKLYF